MKPNRRKWKWSPCFILGAVLIAVFLLPYPAPATDWTWQGAAGTGNWSNPNNWDDGVGGTGVPLAGDTALLTQGDTNDRIVLYDSTSNPLLNSVKIDASGTGTITLQQSANALSAGDEYVGDAGTGAYSQSGGSNTISNDLFLGNQSSSSGAYNLSGGSVSATNEIVGNFGAGAFTQTNGTNTITSNLYLGKEAGSSGTYDQSGGTTSIATLFLAYEGSSSSGEYTLSGSGSLASTHESIGRKGTGVLNQTGGTHTIGGNLYVGGESGGRGEYNWAGGSLSVPYLYVGYSGTGSFTQGLGSSTQINLNNLYLGYNSSGSGTYEMNDTCSLSANFEVIGYDGKGTFIQNGGSNEVTEFRCGYSFGTGTYLLKGGTLTVSGDADAGGRGFGTFTQSGGTHTVGNDLTLGDSSHDPPYYYCVGTYNLENGMLSVADFITVYQDSISRQHLQPDRGELVL